MSSKYLYEKFESGVMRTNPFQNSEHVNIELTLDRFDPCDKYANEGIVFKVTKKDEGITFCEMKLSHTELSYIAREIDHFQEYGFKQQDTTKCGDHKLGCDCTNWVEGE